MTSSFQSSLPPIAVPGSVLQALQDRIAKLELLVDSICDELGHLVAGKRQGKGNRRDLNQDWGKGKGKGFQHSGEGGKGKGNRNDDFNQGWGKGEGKGSQHSGKGGKGKENRSDDFRGKGEGGDAQHSGKGKGRKSMWVHLSEAKG